MTAGANLVLISTLLLDSRREIALKEQICEKNSANVKNKWITTLRYKYLKGFL